MVASFEELRTELQQVLGEMRGVVDALRAATREIQQGGAQGE
jgi:hypothetical protein